MNRRGSRREKYNLNGFDGPAALDLVAQLIDQTKFLEALDVLEILITRYPHNAVPLLVHCHNIYQRLPDTRYALYQARHFNFDIRPGEKVLDVGSGHLPFPFATHLSDISLENHDYGRAGAPFKHIDGKPVYECNIENLPFKDGEFDFVYCSHVLEHVESPERACEELMRVGRRGYLETPSRAKDLFLNTAEISNHLWMVEYNHEDVLVFTEYQKEQRKGLECNILMEMHCEPQSDREKAFAALVLLKSDQLNTMLMWEKRFAYRVNRLSNKGANCAPPPAPPAVSTQKSDIPAISKGRPVCVFLDTYYPEFLNTFYRQQPSLHGAPYAQQLQALLASGFGDSDFYSRWLAEAGFETHNLIMNSPALQARWAEEAGVAASGDALVLEQLSRIKPDIVYCQDMHCLSAQFLDEVKRRTTLLVGQIASSVGKIPIEKYDIIISSLPALVEFFRSRGITSYFVPLAFDSRMNEKISRPASYAHRPIQCSFAGGLATGVHQERAQLLELLARETPIEFYGYGIETLPADSLIRGRYRGEAWGPQMLQVLANSKITVNKHAEIMYPRLDDGALVNATSHFANNMRLYEATGAGALLITEYKDNLCELFEIGKEVVAYRTAEECAALVRYYLMYPQEADAISQAGQQRTLRSHRYQDRMVYVGDFLKRHLRYRKEAERFSAPEMSRISYGYQPINAAEVTQQQRDAWKDERLPALQRALVQQELRKMYRGERVEPYAVLADALKPLLKPGMKLLEIGCSSGYYAEVLPYLLGFQFDYTGVDYSGSMIAMAREYYPQTCFIAADGAAMPFKDREFDIAISSCVILHTPNYSEHIAETARVAERFIIAHRTPVCRKRPTTAFKKQAYGIETVELVFNENELFEILARFDFELQHSNEYHGDPASDAYDITYVFRRTRSNSIGSV